MSASSSLSRAPATAAPSGVRGFAELDGRLATDDGGFLLVRADRAETRRAHAAHVVRRLGAHGSVVAVTHVARSTPVWSEVAKRLGILELDRDPQRAADRMALAASVDRVAIVVAMPAPGSWERLVLVELVNHRSAPRVVAFAGVSEMIQDVGGEVFDVSPVLDDVEQDLWWNAVATSGRHLGLGDRATDLESWWNVARQARPSGDTPLDAASLRAAALLDRVGRSVPTRLVAELGLDRDVLHHLLDAGVVRIDGEYVTLDHDTLPSSDVTLDAADLVRVGAFVLRHDPSDPWAHAHAADLFLEAGREGEAESSHARALELAGDALVRREFVDRWMRRVLTIGGDRRVDLLSRSATRALDAGEADEAHRFAKRALADRADDVDVVLLAGRAAVAMGDLVLAKVALERAERTLAGTVREPEVRAELAEVAYLSGDLETARARAHATLASSPSTLTRLRARNTLGKILLAESAWSEADRHFAEDAHAAAACGEAVAERRARLNRGIALLSDGGVAEARLLFESVLEDGEAAGDVRASAFALDNLAVVALRVHDYARALELSERTLKLRLRLGDRLTTARIVANLAELRRTLGLLDHAEHTLAFGRRLLGPGMPPEWSAHFAVVSARVELDRGDTAAAARAVATAMADGESSKNRQYFGEALRVAARIALEDGNVAETTELLIRAEAFATTDEAKAEVAILGVRLDRARGRVTPGAIEQAMALARLADQEELLAEGLVLSATASRIEGDLDRARSHANEALRLRERVARGLSDDVRAAYFERKDVAGERHLVTILGAPSTFEEAVPETRRSERPSDAKRREFVGDDPAVRGLLAAVRKVARVASTILVRGESGTGKELVAEAIHRASDRANGPLVTVNCAALVETLLLSELFGHEKGAFTGAIARKRGRFEMAEGGTLFLDEIGDISPRTQVALLRVLQERTFERVGGTTPVHADVRIVCATHRDLKKMVERGEFREDLYYRLRGITLEVPALRNRAGDLPAIASSLLGRIAAERGESPRVLSSDALALLARHRWPGNVRELENALRAASLFAETETIHVRHFAENVDELRGLAEGLAAERRARPSIPAPPPGPEPPESDGSLDDLDAFEPTLPPGEASATEVAYAQVRQGVLSLSDMKRSIERDCIARALAETKGNITRAAALLGMKRPRLSQLVKQYGLAAISSEGS
ncbi:MAG: sigma 54-interacting transcriptional regulator [Polyangiaceae bacterium]